MSGAYDFIQQCGTFFLSTVNEGLPAVRPFGAIMEYAGELYFSTANTKDVYRQLLKNPAVQIVATKPKSRQWIRIRGSAIEVENLDAKQAMLDICPVLLKHFDTKECSNFALFKIADMVSTFH